LAENEEDDNEEDESDQGTPSQFSGIWKLGWYVVTRECSSK
jgi:hypothetical protein